MSDTVSSQTKTNSETQDTESNDDPLITERWSNAITYRQLIMSSCIGILQVLWHPYIYDLNRLMPFLFLYNVSSIIVAYPMFYLELAMGIITRKGVMTCWDLAPAIRGVGFTMLLTSMFTAFATGILSAYCLAFFIHSFHVFLPWLHCAASARPACSDRNRAMSVGSDTPAQSFFFNLVLDLRREGMDGGLGKIVWQVVVYYIITWVIVYFISFKRIYSYSKLVFLKDVLLFFVLTCCGVGVMSLHGFRRIFSEATWSSLLNDGQLWQEAIDYSLLQMPVSTGVLIMLGSYCPKENSSLSYTGLITLTVSKLATFASAMVLGATHGALKEDYDTGNGTNIWKGASSSLILWADFTARVPGSQFWSCLIFFSFFLLAVTSTSLLVQTMTTSLTGRSVRKAAWAFLILICTLYIVVGTLTLCTQSGLYVLNSTLYWLCSRARSLCAALLAAFITYSYGQSNFCEDVFFAKGEYPSVLLRIAWAILPAILLINFIAGMGFRPPAEFEVSWALVLTSLLPIIGMFLLYLMFKCRVRNIVGSEK